MSFKKNMKAKNISALTIFIILISLITYDIGSGPQETGMGGTDLCAGSYTVNIN